MLNASKISLLFVALFILFGFVTSGVQAANTCDSQRPINTQFRLSGQGDTPWVSGEELSRQGVRVGQQIDVNCFAKNGTALLEGGMIDYSTNERAIVVSNTSELRNFTVNQAGNYSFNCSSATINSCRDVDNVQVQAPSRWFPWWPTQPSPSPWPTPSPTPSSTPTVTPNHVSSCDSLQVVGGNDSIVPAKVTLRARGSDNRGNIQKYRFYFGDGQYVESDSAEVTHEYNSSGSFSARADVKDSQGNYKSSSSCETSVYVRASSIESHKSACSNVFITADNNGKAPSTVKFEITGYDNKGSIQGYKLDFGNGVVKESTSNTFEQRYDSTGTYQIKGYLKNSRGEYVGGNDGCDRQLVIGSTKPLTTQPKTGMPSVVPLIGFVSGGVGVSLAYLKSRLRV